MRISGCEDEGYGEAGMRGWRDGEAAEGLRRRRPPPAVGTATVPVAVGPRLLWELPRCRPLRLGSAPAAAEPPPFCPAIAASRQPAPCFGPILQDADGSLCFSVFFPPFVCANTWRQRSARFPCKLSRGAVGLLIYPISLEVRVAQSGAICPLAGVTHG